MTGATGPSGSTGATGATGAGTPASFLSAYSTSPQTGTTGTALIFDRNASTAGTDVTHVQNSPQVTVQTPGYYEVSFHGTAGPVSGVTFPATVGLYLEQQGTEVPGAGVQHTFQTSSDTANLSFSQIVEVQSAPAVFQVSGQGAGYFYSGITLMVQKIGSQPETEA